MFANSVYELIEEWKEKRIYENLKIRHEILLNRLERIVEESKLVNGNDKEGSKKFIEEMIVGKYEWLNVFLDRFIMVYMAQLRRIE